MTQKKGREKPDPVTLEQLRDAAWQVPLPAAGYVDGFETELLHAVLRGNENAQQIENRDELLRLLCRPTGQRARMQSGWNGDAKDIEATRTLFGPILASEIMRAVSYPKETFERTLWYPFIEAAF